MTPVRSIQSRPPTSPTGKLKFLYCSTLKPCSIAPRLWRVVLVVSPAVPAMRTSRLEMRHMSLEAQDLLNDAVAAVLLFLGNKQVEERCQSTSRHLPACGWHECPKSLVACCRHVICCFQVDVISEPLKRNKCRRTHK